MLNDVPKNARFVVVGEPAARKTAETPVQPSALLVVLKLHPLKEEQLVQSATTAGDRVSENEVE